MGELPILQHLVLGTGWSMSEALFQIKLDLAVSHRLGVVFHGWKPREVEDAIMLDTGNPSATLQVWFASRTGGQIEDDPRYVEDDPRYDVPLVECRYLWGRLWLTGLDAASLALLRLPAQVLDHDSADGEAYRRLIKRVVRIIHRSVEPLFTALRIVYGQYWIAPFPEWDSRHESLRDYCRWALDLRVSLDGGASWSDFEYSPDEVTAWVARWQEARAEQERPRDYTVYLQEADWKGVPALIQHMVQPDYQDPLFPVVQRLLVEVRYALEGGVSRYAFVEAISLLEVALGSYFRRAAKTKAMLKVLQPLRERDAPLPLKLCAALLNLSVDPEDVDLCLQAIATRNAVVHDGEDPPQEAQALLAAVLRVVSALLPGLPLRFPEFPEEYW